MIKGTVSIISSYPWCTDGKSGFTMVSLKALAYQVWIGHCHLCMEGHLKLNIFQDPPPPDIWKLCRGGGGLLQMLSRIKGLYGLHFGWQSLSIFWRDESRTYRMVTESWFVNKFNSKSCFIFFLSFVLVLLSLIFCQLQFFF